MDTVFKAMFDDDSGATALEYALIASIVSVIIIGSLLVLNTGITEMFGEIRDKIDPVLRPQD